MDSKTPLASLTTLPQWLAYAESLHPKSIALGLERVRTVAGRMGLSFNCPVITVAGTNGKGSTCAMLEAILSQAGYKTAVYSSPHLVRFEERLRLRGDAVQAAELVASCGRVETARAGLETQEPEVLLTYFEFTTLAIFDVITAQVKSQAIDVAILEVGLGGRLDAVNIIDADCAIITSIDIDHTELLGHTREAIGFEKAGILRADRPAIISDPVPPQSILQHAKAIGADVWQAGRDFSTSGDRQQWGWASSAARGGRRYSGLAYPALRGANQLINAAGVLAALSALRERLPVNAQAVRNGLAVVELPGRFQMLPGQPAIVLDVAHNPHAVATLAANLDAMGFFPTTHAVFGSMADKDLTAILQHLNALVERWYFCDLPTPRAAKASDLRQLWQALPMANLANTKSTAACFANPVEALNAALAGADPTDRILVFGSFYTVGAILEHGLPNRIAKHLPSPS